MPKVSTLKYSFNAGEFSPRLDGRVDLQNYQNSCRICQNFLPLTIGAARRRTGTRFVEEVKDSSKETRLIPFKFSVEQAYILEFGEGYMRVYRNGGQVLNVKTITNCADNGGGLIRVTTSADHFYFTGQSVTIANVTGTTEANGTWTVTKIDATNFDLQGSSFVNPYVSGGTSTAIAEIVMPYQEEDLFELKFVQSADKMWIVHPDYQPRELLRFDHSDWRLDLFDFLDGPYLPLNVTSTTITSSAATGTVTLTASAALFVANDVGRLMRIKSGANWGWVEITVYTSSTQVTASVQETVGTVATADWRFGVWSVDNGYPSTVAFIDNRLTFGGVPAYPQRIDMSRPDEYDSFKPSLANGTVDDDHAVSLTLAADDINAIRWMANNEKGLFVGTSGGEWLVRSSNGGVMTPSNVSATRSTKNGSANLDAVKAGNNILFLQGAQRKLLELSFAFESDGFRNNNMTQLAEHITEGGIVNMTYQQEPDSLIWAVRNDGVLLGFTYERAEAVTGWHRHILGGYSDAGQTLDAQVESVAAIPSTDNSHDQLWMVVNRYIDGGTTRYIEYFETTLEESQDQEDWFYLDSGLTYDGAAADTITGLDHLEGETVQVLVEGAVHPDVTVSSGSITLNAEYTKVQVGLQFISKVQSNRIDSGAADGTAQGKRKRIHKVNFLFHNTLGGFVGRTDDDDDLREIIYRKADDPMDTPPPPFSGFREMTWPGGYDKDAYITVVQQQPLPMTILAFAPQLHTFDR